MVRIASFKRILTFSPVSHHIYERVRWKPCRNGSISRTVFNSRFSYPFQRKLSTNSFKDGVTSFLTKCLPSETTHVKYCRECKSPLTKGIPPGDSRERLFCQSCNYVEYQNPKIVVGCIVEHEDQILLCLRGIDPCKGKWTLPAGYLEIGESAASGAIRETLEEANASVTTTAMFSLMSIPVIGQCHIFYRAKLNPPFHFAAGHETLETKLIVPEEIPLDEIAFTSIRETLKAYLADRKLGRFRFHHGVITRHPGVVVSDLMGYELEDYMVQ